MPKSVLQARRGDAPALDDHLGGQRLDGVAQRQMDRHRNDPQPAAGQHHHRFARHAGQRRQIFGMAGIAEPGLIERALLDRVRHHARAFARLNQRHRPLDAAQHGGSVGRIGRARFHRMVQRCRQDRKGAVEDRRRLAGAANHLDRNIQPDPLRQRADTLRIVQQHEGRHRLADPLGPGLQRQFAADARRLAHGEGESGPPVIIRRAGPRKRSGAGRAAAGAEACPAAPDRASS